ncbi:MAG: hypothetical protein U5K74_13535 [Gemmatimonadaceae bacterium]|nr:hypothetical protein [Gemmatimonadaceae bacterium]
MRQRIRRGSSAEIALTIRDGHVHVVHQCLGVAADDRERRAQLVAHVGDEIPPDLLEPADRCQVVHRQHGAAIGQRSRHE